MRIEAPKPYNLPGIPQDPKEAAKDRLLQVPTKTINAAGDEFQLSSKQQVTRSLVEDDQSAMETSGLSPERLAQIKARVSSGYYLTEGAAEETSSAITSFHG